MATHNYEKEVFAELLMVSFGCEEYPFLAEGDIDWEASQGSLEGYFTEEGYRVFGEFKGVIRGLKEMGLIYSAGEFLGKIEQIIEEI